MEMIKDTADEGYIKQHVPVHRLKLRLLGHCLPMRAFNDYDNLTVHYPRKG